MAKKLREAGYTVEDAKEVVRKDSPLFIDLDAIPNAEPIFPAPPKEDQTHPNWHDVPCKVFDSKTFPFEGVRQAQVFTNSVQVKSGLPESVLEMGRSVSVEYQDLLVQRIIKQAFLWDAYLEKLPKLRDLEIPQFKFPRQYGIPLKKRNETLLKNLLRLCETKSPQLALTRAIGGEEELRVSLERYGKPFQILVNPMLTLLAKEELPPLVKPEVTESLELPSIYPFLGNAGVVEQNIYKDGDRLAFKESSPFPYVHTTFFSHHIAGSHTHSHPRWNNDRFSGTTIMYNFATAIMMARRKFGNDVKGILPQPITMQTVHSTGQDLQFSIFQLNNVDLEENSGSSVKNVCWLTPKLKLFSACEYEQGKEKFEGYNPEVFKILMGLYLNNSK
jgi:large subunit ribosomal protein L37